MPKPKEVYKETYKAGMGKIRTELLPATLPYMKDGWIIDSMEIHATGEMDDGREFQDLRVYTKEV